MAHIASIGIPGALRAGMHLIKRRLTTTVLLSLLSAGGSRAALAAPKQGDFELRLGNTSTGILGIVSPSGVESESLTVFGLHTGFGYFASDQIELGISLDLAYVESRASQALVAFAPFLKALVVKDRLGFFFQIAPGVAHVRSDDDSGSAFDLNVALGLEAFVTPMWSLRLGPKYELVMGDGGDTVHGIGATWGISAYF